MGNAAVGECWPAGFHGSVNATNASRCSVINVGNPTAENIAIWIWEKIKTALPPLSAVTVYETGDCWAEYSGC